MKNPPLGWGLSLALLVLALGFPTTGAAEATLRERIDEQLTVISKFAINARAKLSNGVVGRPSGGASGSAASAVQSCCSNNIERMHRSVIEVRGLVGELEACYIDSANEGAMGMSSVFVADLNSFTRAIDGFADASSPYEGMNRLAALTRLYVILSDSGEALAECPEVASDTHAAQDGDVDENPKKKKKKKKKEKDSSEASDSGSS